ncbi:hypothetical protein VFPFJ_01400 [Purpureocillium lilacinum]|uniref:Uncharacterized protein n=1 Tax=Purpureocillium lilacinum TaxID=33203 RepID=A0A179I0Y4_PURLI|nr:hypothetical protein VFPFJ_01400 [Purpureocillium lilacinum]OAQ87339.1 hypothetical protein VFPBJ_01379 [Purpureocillium lilacinum]OAQ95290.1 hypothetical protein VFPFJ_01400 [Purpureocillium lilacinum]
MSCRHARRSRYEPLHPSGIVASKSSQVRSSRRSQRSGWGGELSVVGVRHGHPETQSRPPGHPSFGTQDSSSTTTTTTTTTRATSWRPLVAGGRVICPRVFGGGRARHASRITPPR